MLVLRLRPHRLRSLLTAGSTLFACALVLTPLALAVSGHGPRGHSAVIGGAAATEGQYPSAAFVLDVKGKLAESCSGTVVAPSLVLTAAHCAENVQTGVVNPHRGYYVVTSRVDLAATQPAQVSRVIGVIPYPGYERHHDPGDAALLVLEKPVTAPPMPLVKVGQTRLYDAGTLATFAGWGLTSTIHPKVSKQLRYASTVVQPASWCKRHIRPFFPRWEICTFNAANVTSNACNGDSGGPLMVPSANTGEMVEVGIAAFVFGPCSPRYPTVFTRLQALSGWLRSWIAAYSTATVRQPALTSPPLG
ncbi:MAG TPA: serine protease [Solirubrobacteraceae bacterium]|jgi:secreted trypsin-like serine protease|nr:serine protease [Solirubrobacteraceae bacterium]